MVLMSDTPLEQGAECDTNYGVRYIDAQFVIVHRATPPCHPAEDSFDDPAPGETVEPFGSVDLAHHFDDELQEGSLVRQLCPIVSVFGEEMVDPRLALVDCVENHLGVRTVGDTGGRRRDIVDRVEQQPRNETAKPSVNRLPGRKIAWQHRPVAPRSNRMADRVHHPPQIGPARSISFGRRGQPRPDRRPFLFGHVGRAAFQVLSIRGHPATGLVRPHPRLESRVGAALNPSSKSL